jgi:hypothetical protein
LKINRRFGGIYRLKVQARNQREAVKSGRTWCFAIYLLHAGFLINLTLNPEMQAMCSSER